MTEQDRKEAEAIADARIARALRMLAERFRGPGKKVPDDVDAIAAALESPPAPDPRTAQATPEESFDAACDRIDKETGEQFVAMKRAMVGCAAPSTLPPLVGPESRYGNGGWFDHVNGVGYSSDEAAHRWQYLARAERAAREADIARLLAQLDEFADFARRSGDDMLALRQRAETAEREREEAQATTAQLTRELAASLDAQAAATVERNSLRRAREACLTALGVKP